MIDYTDQQLMRSFYQNFDTDPFGCLIHKTNKPSTKTGHTRMTLKGEREYVHRISLGFKLGRTLGPDEVARHICGNGYCANPECLEIGTKNENFEDELR